MHDPTILPPNLPVPRDDGRCLHLRRRHLPAISLPATGGGVVDLARVGRCVIFLYPRTGVPRQPPGLGFAGEEWDSIPGARGCTPQSCGFRDLHGEFESLGVRVWGLSTNTTEHQREFKLRNHIPFEILSDASLELTRALNLPTFEFPVDDGPTTLVHRAAWYVEPDAAGACRITKVWYPVFPPDRCAATVLEWLRTRLAISIREAASSDDLAFVRERFIASWGGPYIWSRGVRYDLEHLQPLIAEVGGRRIGLVTLAVVPGGYQCEVATLNAFEAGAGVGAALLDAAADFAASRKCRRVFLTTSNDNVHAIEFYQRQGWRMCALHPNAINAAREWTPGVPRIADNGIPVRDELEFELPL